MDSVIAAGAANLLQLVERSAFVGFWRLDARRRELYWSEQLARMHGAAPGYTPSYEQALSHYAPEHRAELEARLLACERDGTPFDIEVQVDSVQGRRTWVRCVGQPLRDGSGAIVGVEGLVQEIAPAGY
ncbi:MAG TPA: PAS domain-containing protein, partial [Polyangiales bacterium]